jgi:hypothetical protein
MSSKHDDAFRRRRGGGNDQGCTRRRPTTHNREFALGANVASFRLATSLQIYAVTPVILGMFALYAIIARTRARRSAIAGLVLTVVGAGCLLPGTGYAAFVMPAAGILISQGHDQDVLLLLDQVFTEPGWIPVFLGGLLYNVGLLIMSIAVWRSRKLSRWTAGLLAAAALVGLPIFLDVVALARVGANQCFSLSGPARAPHRPCWQRPRCSRQCL